MLETLDSIQPFDYKALIDYASQFKSVTFTAMGRRNNFVHIRDKAKSPVRDLDGQQLRILLESLGIKVYSRVTRDAYKWNFYFSCDNYVEEIPEDSLPIIFPMCGIPGGAKSDAWIWLHDLVDSGRPYLWWFNDQANNPTKYTFTRIHPDIANAKTVGMIDLCTYHINYNLGMVKESKVQPSIDKFCWAAGVKRNDLSRRMRYLTPNYTECYGLNGREELGFTFNGAIPPDQLVDVYSSYIATLFSTSSTDILNNVTPRFYETMCSNAVVFFDTENDLDMLSWKFRKITSKEDAIKKLKYIIDHPDFRQKLVNEQHEYIKKLDDHLKKM